MIPSKMLETLCGIKVSSMLAIMMMTTAMAVWGGDSLVTSSSVMSDPTHIYENILMLQWEDQGLWR